MIDPFHRKANMPRTAIHHGLVLALHTPASLFFVVEADGDEVEVDVEDIDVAVPVVVAVLTKTYISPVESLLINKRP